MLLQRESHALTRDKLEYKHDYYSIYRVLDCQHSLVRRLTDQEFKSNPHVDAAEANSSQQPASEDKPRLRNKQNKGRSVKK